MSELCPNCGTESEWLSQHWNRSADCDFPELGDHRHEIITGVLMGDGYLARHSKNAHVVVQMTTPEYLCWLDSEFGIFSTGVRKTNTSEEMEKRARKTNSRGNVNTGEYSDVFELSTRTHPELNRYREWYSSGEKCWPEVDITPTVMKHLYVCDGNYDNNKSHNRVRISMSNEIQNMNKVKRIFDRSGITIGHFDTSERKDGSSRCLAVIPKAEKQGFFDYIGTPLPGFEYKWPN